MSSMSPHDNEANRQTNGSMTDTWHAMPTRRSYLGVFKPRLRVALLHRMDLLKHRTILHAEVRDEWPPQPCKACDACLSHPNKRVPRPTVVISAAVLPP